MNAHVVGLGGAVVLPGNVCGLVAKLLREGVRRVNATDGRILVDLTDLFVVLDDAARVHQHALRLAAAHLDTERSADRGPQVDTETSAAEDSEMNIKQAAEVIGVSTRHVRRLASKGRIKGELDGQTWTLHRPSVVAFASSRSVRRKRNG